MTALNAPETKFYFSVPVWGDNHVGLFIDIGLPSLLSPGNLPGMSCIGDCRFFIHTRPEDEARLIGSPAFQRLSRLMPVEIRSIPDGIVSPYRTMSQCHMEIMRLADADHVPALFPSPDHVWADGSMVRLEQIAASGKTVVHALGIRLDRDAVVGELAKWKTGDAALTIPPRSLVTLGLGHLHRIAHYHFWKRGPADPGNQFNPANILWRVGDEGLVAHCFHLHPLMVRSEIRFAEVIGTIDDDLVLQASPDISKHYLAQDSDELLCFEISAPAHDIDLPCTRGSIEDVALWAETWANSLHRQLVRAPLRLHAGEPTESMWRAVETEASQAIECVARVWDRGPLGLYAFYPAVFHARRERYREKLKSPIFRLALRTIDLLRVLKILPVSPRLMLLQGEDAIKVGDFEGAYSLFKQAAATLPDDAGVLSRTTMAAMAFGELEEAAGYAGCAVALAPHNLDLTIQHAGVMQALHRWDQAVADYDLALAAFPERQDLQANRARVHDMMIAVSEGRASARPPLRRTARAQKSLEAGDAAMTAGDYANAARAFETALADHPDDVDILSRCVGAAMALEDAEAAARYADRAVALDPTFAELTIQHAGVMQALHRWEAALADYDRALAVFPERDDLQVNRATVLDMIKAVWEGRMSGLPPIRRTPRAQKLIEKGDAAMAAGDIPAAEQSFANALAEYPEDIGILSRCITAATNLGETIQAAQYADRAVALDPNNVALIIQHAGTMQAMRFWGRALADYDRAVAILPERADLYVNRAQVLDHLSRALEAEADREKAAALDARPVAPRDVSQT